MQRLRTVNGIIYPASRVKFGTWNGSTVAGTLVDPYGNPISSASVSAIHRTDWQGRQLLYPTARENYQPLSANIAAWGGGTSYFTFATATSIIPGQSAVKLTNNGSNSAPSVFEDPNAGATSGGWETYYVIVEEGTATDTELLCYWDGASYYAQMAFSWATGLASVKLNSAGTLVVVGQTLLAASGPNGGKVYQIFVAFNTSQAPIGSQRTPYTLITGSTTNTDYAYMHGAQWNLGQSPTPFLVTTSTPAPVTDYTLNGTGVTFAQAPASTATTDWDGVYV